MVIKFSMPTYVSWGRILGSRGAPGDGEQARDLLSQALQMAALSGYAGMKRPATGLLSKV